RKRSRSICRSTQSAGMLRLHFYPSQLVRYKSTFNTPSGQHRLAFFLYLCDRRFGEAIFLSGALERPKHLSGLAISRPIELAPSRRPSIRDVDIEALEELTSSETPPSFHRSFCDQHSDILT